MYKSLLKQTLNIMRKNVYLCLVIILGTALSVSLITTWIISYRSVSMDIYPEVNRSRSLYVKWVGVKEKTTNRTYGNGKLSLKTIQECFQSLITPENISITTQQKPFLVGVKHGKQRRCYVFPTDDIFWKINDFHLISGKLYDKADFDTGLKKVVIGERLADHFFASAQEAVGQTLMLNRTSYTVCGVVKDVYTMTNYTYAQAWIPFTSLSLSDGYGHEKLMGDYRCVILAHSKKDLPAIREEINRQVLRFNESLSDVRIDLYGQPDTKFVEDKRGGAGSPDMTSKCISYIVICLIILLVPAINMSGLTLSISQGRIEEFGIRKAFGATKGDLIKQIMFENMFYSLIGGIIGLAGSYFITNAITTWAFSSSNYFGIDIGEATLPPGVYFNIETFAFALLFCTLLNITSACIPAWRTASTPIINSFTQDDHD